jgi:hypothetical protein
MIAGLAALLFVLWSTRRMSRGINEHAWRALEECGSALAPLLVFALLWLMADLVRRPNARARLQDG